MPGNTKLPEIASLSSPAVAGYPRAAWYPRQGMEGLPFSEETGREQWAQGLERVGLEEGRVMIGT